MATIKSGKILTSLVFFFMAVGAFAQSDINVKMNINPKEVEVGERFVVAIEVSASEMVSVTEPSAPTVDGAQYLGVSKSQRVNSSMVANAQGELEFKTIQTQAFYFNFQAAKNGDLIVPAVGVQVAGKVIKSPAGQLKVWAQGVNRPRPQARPSRPSPFGDDEDHFGADPFAAAEKMEERFNQLLQRHFGGGGAAGFQAVPAMNAEDAFVIVAEVDKTEVFEGEQITASWYLFTKAGVREIDTLKYPDLKGFWKEDIELATLLNFQPAELNGQVYNKALLASYALFPIEDGKATIDAYRAKVTVVGGMGKSLTSTKSSEVIPILAKPLPEAGKPANFSGAVGDYQLTAQVESRSVVAHQPFTLKVHIEGRGNAKQFELPNPQLPSNVELYDIKKESQFFKNGLSFKNFEILLIPRQEGEITIPPIVTSVFNPKTQKYQELTTPEFKLTVLPGTGQQGLDSSRLTQEKADDSEAPLNLLSDWSPQNSSPAVMAPVWGAAFGATALALVVLAAFQLQWFKKPLTIREQFHARLKNVEKHRAQKKWRDVGAEATNVAYFVLGEISGQGGANLQIEKLLEKAPPSVRREVGADLRNVIDKFYLLGFGPDEAVQKAAQSDLVKEDIKTLEKLLSKAIELSGAEMKS